MIFFGFPDGTETGDKRSRVSGFFNFGRVEFPQKYPLRAVAVTSRCGMTNHVCLTPRGVQIISQSEVNTLFSFNEAMQKAKAGGQFIFDQRSGEPVNPRLIGNTEQWSFSLNLLHPEANGP